MKTRLISGFAAVVLIAAAAATSAAAARGSPAHAVAPTGSFMLKDLVVDVNKLPTEHFEDMSLVFSKH